MQNRARQQAASPQYRNRWDSLVKVNFLQAAIEKPIQNKGMSTKVNPIPDGFQTANVYLIVGDVRRQLAFLVEAFGAEELHRSVLPDGNIIHADVRLGTSRLMVGQARGQGAERPSTTYLYVEDVDARFKQAVAAGAKSLAEPHNQFYGDRSGGVEDPCGNQWWIATHVEDVSQQELSRRFADMGNKHS